VANATAATTSTARDVAEATRVAIEATRDMTIAHNTIWWGKVLKNI